ncbi:MAG TPA: transcription elongation factor GreA [Polyangia bacterium]|nr:transcription elongation factor GreA [Polyangia bacterium]
MDQKIPMTPRGYARLKEELAALKAERPRISKLIEEARGHGDLSENADYDAAKNKQGLTEARIRDLEAKIALANVIDPTKLSGDRVVFGATVTLCDSESGDEMTYTIVGEDEADVKAGRIAITAPVARALIGKEVGDSVRVKTPKGGREVEVVAIKFLAI